MPAEYLVPGIPLFVGLTLVAVPIFLLTSLNRIKVTAFEVPDIWRTGIATGLLAVSAAAISYAFGLVGPRSIPLIFAFLFLGLHIVTRLAARSLLIFMTTRTKGRIPTAIYGAGSTGVELLAALRQNLEVRPVMFVDDNLTLQKMTVSGLPVYPQAALEAAVRTGRVRRILLAIPSMDETLRRRKIKELTELGCEVYSLPSINEMMQDKGLADALRPVTPDMLLGRDKVNLEIPEVARTYTGRRILITGAGGSIGSELSRQILRCKPASLTLLDHSEYALYSIHHELKSVAPDLGIKLTARLGSVCDAARMAELMAENEIDIVLHAAAYKHVPLVEDNEVEGVYNNVIGTQTVADAAETAGVERFILISTDKAVRPTNIMGASKRLAELVIQDRQTRASKTKFSMVRFGNVLGSSGSVIPLFQRQIAAGGPVTLTHEKITRYFMTIPEAARLVLLAGAYAEGGDVFVLDMGAPVNIADLARKMIELSGRTVRDVQNPAGDIEICTVGLRPGEKLYEELLIGDNTLPTPHPKIMRAQETQLSELECARVLQSVRRAHAQGSRTDMRKVISESVEGYHTQDALRQEV